jgi:hypothetical protein
MKLEISHQTPLKTINEVCQTGEQSFERYIQAKNAFLEKRDQATLKQVMESAAWHMGQVA